MPVTLHGAATNKRRFDQTEDHVKHAGKIVIELSDSEDEKPSVPLAKRQKSHTPAENGSESDLRPQSRTQSEDAKPRRLATPPASGSSRAQPSIAPTAETSKRSPWKKLSRFAVLDEAVIDLIGASPPALNARGRQPSTTSLPTRNGVQSESRASSFFDKVKAARQSRERIPSSSESRVEAKQSRRKDTYLSKGVTGPFARSEKSERLVTSQRKETVSRPDRAGQGPVSSSNFSVNIPRPTPGPLEVSSKRRHERQPSIEVVIDSPSQELLRQFQGTLPKSKVQLNAEKNSILAQLEQSTQFAHEKPELVERYFGTTGFSAVFGVEEDLEFMRNAASKKNKKKKKANRANIKLEIESLSGSLDRLNFSKSLIHPARTARDILTSRFEERSNPPLTFSNDINDRRLPGKFQFIDRYIIGPKVKIAPPSTNSGCDCTNCTLSTCKCFTKESKGREKQVEIYVRRPDGVVVLSDEFIARGIGRGEVRQEITECNEHCKCGDHCWNRVVCKGRTVPLEIFQTEKCGFGVRSSKDIVKGQFIELYLGEVLTEAEMELREDAAEEHQDSYVYMLDWFGAAAGGERYHVDGMYFGSAMRFVNHSCNPNAWCFPVQSHRKDKRVYDLGFFAIKDIKAGVEIRIDYQNDGVPDDEQLSEDLVKCQCGEDNCRGILWRPGVKTRRRRRRQQ